MRRIILGWFILLTACGGRGPITTTMIEAVLGADRYTPSQWRVPGGQEITLKLSNPTTEEREWALFINLPSEPFSEEDESKLILKFSALPGQTQTVVFTSPAAPGEYSVTSTLPGQLEAGLIGKITVVQPGY